LRQPIKKKKMGSFISFKRFSSALTVFIFLLAASCESNYRPRTVPDSVPPVITVRLTGEQLNRTYKIQGMEITPLPPAITPTLMPGKNYRASIIAADTIGLFNLRVGLNRDYFELSDISATPGVLTTSESGDYTIVDVTLPISPAKTGTALIFTFRAKPMDRKSTRLNSSHITISYAVFCLKKKK